MRESTVMTRYKLLGRLGRCGWCGREVMMMEEGFTQNETVG